MKNLKRKLENISIENFLKGLILYSVLVFLIIFLVFPLGTLFVRAFQRPDGSPAGFEQFARYFTNPAMLQSVGNTFFVAVVSTLVSVGLAFLFSYSLSRKNIRFKNFFRYIGMVPIFAPTMLLGIALIYLFGNKGILTAAGLGIPLYGKVGIIIAESIYCFPVATTILMVAFSGADNRLYEAADSMGTSAWRKMITITIPNVKYGLISALFVSFTYSFTDFGAPSVVGGNYNVLATDVYKQVVGQQNFNMGAVVGIVLLFPAVLSFAVDRITSSKQNASISSKAVPYVIKPHKTSDRLAAGFCWLITAAMLLFFGVALFASLIKLWPYNLTLTLKNYDLTRVAAGAGTAAFRNSVLIALAAAAVGTVACFLTAYMTERIQKFPKTRKLTYFLGITPLAIPGTVVGLSYILFFNASWFGIPFTSYALQSPFYVLYGTIWIVIFADIIHFFSVPFTTAVTSLKRLDKEFETVSESMGVPFYHTLGRVIIPLCLPAIIEMFVYYFVNALVTVSAVVFIYSARVPLAAVAIVNLEGAGDTAPAAAMCMLLLFINLGVRLIYEAIRRHQEKKGQRP